MSGMTEERLAPANGIEIAYQEIGDPGGEPLLLVMGLATQMIGWDEEFCGMIAERGYRVIRFDNRDVGHSTKLSGKTRRADMMLGRRSTASYLLTDMAADTLGLMDHLEIESAHLVGASMGGMIVQTMAIERPHRVRSLVSIMSNTGNRWTGMPTWKASTAMLAPFPKGRSAYIDRVVKTFGVIGSPGYPMDEARVRAVAGASYDRGNNPAGVLRQMHAISASGNRTAALRRLRLPATVIHGSGDPLVRPAAGRATAQAIPGARLRMMEGMGHDLPHKLWPTFVEEIAANASRAGQGAAEKQTA